MAIGQLSLYQGALRELNEARLHPTDGLSENVEARYILDDVWNDNFLNYLLEQADWRFATRTAQVDYDPAAAPSFGYKYVFPKPDDYVRTVAISQDEYFNCPLDFSDEGGLIFCDIQTIYLRYVSNDVAYGLDYTKWPDTFNKYAQKELARMSCKSITGKEPDDDFKKDFRLMKLEAVSKDALNDSNKFPPQGKWAMAHYGRRNSIANIRITNLPGDY